MPCISTVTRVPPAVGPRRGETGGGCEAAGADQCVYCRELDGTQLYLLKSGEAAVGQCVACTDAATQRNSASG